MTPTPRRLALAAGAALLLLTGCGDNGEARPGAAAVVGGTSISTDALRSAVERGLADERAQAQFGADRAGYQQRTLTRLVNDEVIAQAAAENGITVTDGELGALRALYEEQSGGAEALADEAAASGIAPEDVDVVLRSVALRQELGEALTEDAEVSQEELRARYEAGSAQYDAVRSRHILLEDEATARQVLADVTADRSRFAELAAQLSIDPSNKDAGGDLGLAGRGQYVPAFEDAVFGAEEGDLVLVQTEFGWHVVEVQERRTTTFAQAEPELRRAALQEQRDQLVDEELAETARRLGVTVNPRFGAWDRETAAVVAAEGPDDVVSPGPEEGTGGEAEAPAPAESPAAQ